MRSLLSEDKDADIRAYAAMALGGIEGASEPAVPLLVQKIQDNNEATETRTQCASRLPPIGKCSAAVEAIPALLGVIGNPVHEPKLRERVIWALRVHRPDDIRKKDNIRDTLGKVLVEPAARQNNMLRYDCDYMLGMIWQKDAPEATLDVLTEFLKDDSIKIFDRTASSVGGSRRRNQQRQNRRRRTGHGGWPSWRWTPCK